MEKPAKLPVGMSSFERIRADDFLYVDKTRHLHRLIAEGVYYFLSRPRRFGKSLTVSALKNLFEGKRELFEGLWISEHGDWEWKPHPVVVLDFNGVVSDTPENMETSLYDFILETARTNDIELRFSLLKDRFRELLVALSRKTGERVAILVDEYDKPMIDHLGKGERALDIAKANRDILKSFFGTIKHIDVASVVRFVFMTGVSKFGKVSVFSELNNLHDLTLDKKFADMLGYTREELATYFSDHIRRLAESIGVSEAEAMEILERHYDGYRFSKRDIRMYNPFSILSALKNEDTGTYWFETGTPAFLVNLLKQSDWYLPEIEGMMATEPVFGVFDLERLAPEALLFQTGYVTIKDVQDAVYTFDYPNREVKAAFLETLFHSWTRGLKDKSRFALLGGYLDAEDYERFFETVSAIFAMIPNILESKRDDNEKFGLSIRT